jgi:hypothetical protein
MFAPHPAFAKKPDGSFVLARLKEADVDGKFADGLPADSARAN